MTKRKHVTETVTGFAGPSDRTEIKAPTKRAKKTNAPATSAALTASQQIMIADGAPAGVFITQAQRDEAWRNKPPRALPVFSAPLRDEGEDTKRFRAMIEAQERTRKSSAADVSPHIQAKRAARAAKPPRPSREGMTSVADIAATLKTIPRIARAALRAAKEPKPPQGWAFTDAKEVARITNIIKEALACPPTKSKKPERVSKRPSPKSTPKTTPKVAASKSIKRGKKSAKRSASSTSKRK